MGRRSINTTKSGKYMNPTDQARKEARKRELKKNKKQRMIVRAAVLKGKDPHQILADMERLDQMEYNVNVAPPLNEKVLKDKRRKLKETWDRLTRLYHKEDNDKFLELKRLEADYDAKRNELVKFYEAVKSTQDVELDDIPLPAGPVDMTQLGILSAESSAVGPSTSEPSSILKKAFKVTTKLPPGVPPGPPPVWSDVEDELEEEKGTSKKVRFGADSSTSSKPKEADISEFLKEIEQVEKTVSAKDSVQPPKTSTVVAPPVPPTAAAPNLHCVPPPLFMLRPSVPSVNPNIRQGPPGAPMQPRPSVMRPPNIPPQRMPQQMTRNTGPQNIRPQSSTGPNPGNRKDDKRPTHVVSDKATIEAKPQLRNLSADATRFTPVSLKVKRNEKLSRKQDKRDGTSQESSFYSSYQNPTSTTSAPTKDDAYEVFMKELQGLL